MAKYLIKASYSPEGIKGVMAKGGTARADAIAKLAAGVGGSVASFHFAFGGDDVFVVVEAPSHEAMVAIAGAVIRHRCSQQPGRVDRTRHSGRHHRALRQSPRKPRPTRRPLPQRPTSPGV